MQRKKRKGEKEEQKVNMSISSDGESVYQREETGTEEEEEKPGACPGILRQV